MMSVDDWLRAIDARLDTGARQYGDRSFVRPAAVTLQEIDQELVDLPGWIYVLWCQAARKTDYVRDQTSLRAIWRQNLAHRIACNDRRKPSDIVASIDPHGQMAEIEVVAMDCFYLRQQLVQRLQPIVRAIEVTQATVPHPYRGPRGSTRDPRSDD